jgi:hypothetical protein
MSWDAGNSNLNLITSGFGQGMFIGNRFTNSSSSSTYVTHDGLNDAGNAKITAYDANGNPSIQASNNGNRSIVYGVLLVYGTLMRCILTKQQLRNYNYE